jgi:beta-barrel assembly-enhancing protease
MVGDYVAKYSDASNKKYQFIVTADREADAMTAGGGRVYISLGMLELIENEDELAAVLAHEIAHDVFHHAARMVTRQMFWLTETRKIRTPEEAEAALAELNEQLDFPVALGERLLGFARFDELEADRAAFYNIYKAGYNPEALTTSLRRLQRQKDENGETDGKTKLFLLLFGSHPPTDQRTFALSWESNFVKMPPRNSFHSSAAFDQLKRQVKAITKDN